MASYFFDSSAIVKRYVSEIGSVFVDGLADPTNRNIVLLARTTHVEVVAALSRRLKSGSVSQADAQAAITAFKQDIANQYLSVEITPSLIKMSMDFAEKYALRGYDAMQLASAIESNNELLSSGLLPLVLISADIELNIAAAAEGLSVDDPNNHP